PRTPEGRGRIIAATAPGALSLVRGPEEAIAVGPLPVLRRGLEAIRLHYAARVDQGEDDVPGERTPGRAKALQACVNRRQIVQIGARVALLRRCQRKGRNPCPIQWAIDSPNARPGRPGPPVRDGRGTASHGRSHHLRTSRASRSSAGYSDGG